MAIKPNVHSCFLALKTSEITYEDTSNRDAIGIKWRLYHMASFQHKPHVQTLRIQEGNSPEELTSPSLIVSEAVSVIVPTLNEAANVAQILLLLAQTLTQAAIPYEVIVVDDHSTDDTILIAERTAQEQMLPVRVLLKQGRPGKSVLIDGRL